MQGLGRPEEETGDGFNLGGFGANGPQVRVTPLVKRWRADGCWRRTCRVAVWRRTYDALLAPWNATGSPFKEALNKTPKYIASTTLSEPLVWPNSTLLEGDVADAVRDLKARVEGVLAIMGSGKLMAADLIDEYQLMMHPIVLGSGRRLFCLSMSTCRFCWLKARQRPRASSSLLMGQLRNRSKYNIANSSYPPF